MNIHDVGGGSYSEFLQLIQSARTRNAGFETPLAKTQKSGAARGNEPVNRVASVNNPYAAQKSAPAMAANPSAQSRQALGTQFDAYA